MFWNIGTQVFFQLLSNLSTSVPFLLKDIGCWESYLNNTLRTSKTHHVMGTFPRSLWNFSILEQRERALTNPEFNSRGWVATPLPGIEFKVFIDEETMSNELTRRGFGRYSAVAGSRLELREGKARQWRWAEPSCVEDQLTVEGRRWPQALTLRVALRY